MLFSLKEGLFNVKKPKQKVIFHMHSETKGYFFLNLRFQFCPVCSNTGYLGHILKSVVPFGSKINGFSSLRSLFASTLVRS